MIRDGEVKQRQHFYHHGDTICHPKSGYVTTKLHGTSTCRCNNNAIFSDRAMFTFPASSYAGHVNLAGAKHCQFMQSLNGAINIIRFTFLYANISALNCTTFKKVLAQ